MAELACKPTRTMRVRRSVRFEHCRKKEVGTSATDERSVKVLGSGGRACINKKLIYLASCRTGAHSMRGTIYIVRDDAIL
jgi:hypothetical protein